jgi:hypothetical protein
MGKMASKRGNPNITEDNKNARFDPVGPLPIPGEKLSANMRGIRLQESVDRVIQSLPTGERSRILREIITQGLIDRGLLKI